MVTPPAPGSKAYRDQLRSRLVALGFAADQITAQLAADLLSRTDMRPREAWRQANELSLTAAAGRFNAVRGDAGATMTKSRIWDYERWPGTGGVRPTVPVLRILAQVYGTTWDQLVDVTDLPQMPVADREEYHTAFTARLRATGPLRDLGGRLPLTFRGTISVADGPLLPSSAGPYQPGQGIGAPYSPVQGEVLTPHQVLPPDTEPEPRLGAAGPPAVVIGEPVAALDIPLATAPQRPEGNPAPDALIEVAAAESARLAIWAGATNVTDDVLVHLNDSLRTIAHSYLCAAPLPLLVRARQLRSTVTRLLQGHQRPDQSRELYLLGARACTLLAWMSGDLGNYAAADEHAFAAWMCAEMAAHDGARMWVRATQSKLAYWSGRYVESARLAADGLRYQPRDSAAVLLALLQARAWARTGRTDDAEAALRRWLEVRADIPGPDEVGGVLGCSHAQEHYMAGSTRLWMRQPDKALIESGWAIVLFERSNPEERFYGAEGLTRIDAARAHLLNGELEGAAQALDPVLAVDSGQRLETFLQSLTHLRGMLADRPFRDAATARLLQERIEDYAATAIGRGTAS